MSEKRVYMPAFLLFVPNVNVLTPLFLEKPPPRHTLAPFIFRQMTKQSTHTTRLSFFFPRGTIRYGTYMCISNSGQNLSQLGGDWRERNMILHSTCCSFLFSTLCCNSDWNWWGGCVAHLHTHTPHYTSSNNYRVHFLPRILLLQFPFALINPQQDCASMCICASHLGWHIACSF